MPPRHHYWTIILEGKPTAFRAHTQDELMPTLRQLQSRHPDAVLKWFARGRLWNTQEEERNAALARAAAEGLACGGPAFTRLATGRRTQGSTRSVQSAAGREASSLCAEASPGSSARNRGRPAPAGAPAGSSAWGRSAQAFHSAGSTGSTDASQSTPATARQRKAVMEA